MSLSLQTQHRIADFFIVLYDGERQAEIMRQVLVEQRDFSPVSLFQHISQGRDVITSRELAYFLEAHGVQFTQSELEQVLSQYGSAEELLYNNFLNIILPSLASSLRNVKPGRVKPPAINQHVECAFAKVIWQEINLTRQLEMVREDLNSRWDFSEEGSYALLETFAKSKKVDHMALKRFFMSLSLSVTEDDILYLLRRADRDKDGKFGRQDFSTLVFGSKSSSGQRKHSRLNIHRTASKVVIKTKPTPSKTLPSPAKSAQKVVQQSAPRRSNEALFRKISQLATHSPSKKTSRTERQQVTPDQSFSKRNISQFDPQSSNKKLVLDQYPVTEIGSMSVSPNQRKGKPHFESLESLTHREMVGPRHYGVDARVINEDTAELVNVLVHYIEHFQIVDQSRCQIVSFADFSYDRVARLFKGDNPVVSMHGFEIVANDVLGCEYSMNDIKTLFQVVDIDKDGLLNENELWAMFEPTSEYYANILHKKGLEDRELHPETLEAIKLLLDQMISMQSAYNENKQHFFQKKRYSLLSLFEHLNHTKSGHLTAEDFEQLFLRYQFNATQSEIEQVVRRFTKDKLVRTVTMRQFLNELTPNH